MALESSRVGRLRISDEEKTALYYAMHRIRHAVDFASFALPVAFRNMIELRANFADALRPLLLEDGWEKVVFLPDLLVLESRFKSVGRFKTKPERFHYKQSFIRLIDLELSFALSHLHVYDFPVPAEMQNIFGKYPGLAGEICFIYQDLGWRVAKVSPDYSRFILEK